MPLSKRALLGVSRSIESVAASLGRQGEPALLVGLFQEPAYLSASLAVYRELEGRVSLLVGCVGPVGDVGGIPVVDLPAGHPLGEEWLVLLASPQRCAGLVARDMRVSGPGRTLEGARLFEAHTTTAAREVAGQLRRLVSAAGEHMPAADAGRLRSAAEVAGGSARGDRPAGSLQASWSAIVERTEQQQRMERAEFTDTATGALNDRFLDTYLDSVGPRSPELAVAALLVGDADTQDGSVRPADDGTLRAVVDIVRSSARPGDVVARRGDQLLVVVVVMPGVSLEDAQQVAARVAERAGQLPTPVLLSAAVGVFPPTAVDVEGLVDAVHTPSRRPDRLIIVDGDDAHVAPQAACGDPDGR